MDGYVLSAEEQAKVIRRSYNRTRAYVQSEIEKILHHVGGEDTLAYEYRMKRLTALLQNTEKRIKELYGITVEDTTEFLKNIIPEAYYHTIFDIAKGTGIEPNFAAVNEKLINSIVKEPWSGKNYSKRIWSNMDKLENELRDVLTDAAMNGESIGKTSRKVAESFNTASYNAERLIRTETTYACNQAELASYEELDIDRYKYVATLDTRTSPICQQLDGKIFETEKARAGLNLPAMHPNCRSTTIPYFEDFEPEERAARDADGNPIQVPANMTYPEWYDKYVKPQEGQKTPPKPPKPSKGKDTTPKPNPPKTAPETPERVPEKPPAEVEIPAPKQSEPEFVDTPIPKRPTEVPRPEPKKAEETAPKATVAESKKPKFTPMKTVEEAAQYLKKFLVEKTWSGNGNGDLKGLSLDIANKVCETLNNLYEEFDLPKFSNILPMNFKKNIWKGEELTPLAYRNLSEGELYLNPKLLKNIKNLDVYFADGKNAFEICKNNLDKFKGKDLATVQKYLEAGRSLIAEDVDDRLKAIIEHEIGHHIQNQIIALNPEFVKIVKEGFEKYSVKISGYATKTIGEYIAESFSAYRNGRSNLIDPELKKIFDSLRRAK